MRYAIQRFKYSREYERGRDLGRLLAARYETLWPRLRVDAIVPVPLHPRRYRERGFNQSQVLAEALAGVARAPVIQALVRNRHTTPQVRLKSTERVSNLRDAFNVDESGGELIHGSRVLVVDDVTTTGATIAAVASALQRAGVKEVCAFTLAREQ